MALSNWRQFLRSTFRSNPRAIRRKPQRACLQLEVLEDRAVPAWIGATAGTTNDAAHDYNNPANWALSVIDDSFAGVTLTADTTLYLSADRTTTAAGLNLGYGGNFALTLLSNSATTRTLTLAGNITGDFGGVDVQTVKIGSSSNPISIDLGAATRTATVAGTDDDLLVNAVMSNGGLTKAGPGILTLGAANTYTGATTVSAGTLRLAAQAPPGAAGYYSFDSVSGTTVNNGGTLGAAKNGTLVNGAGITTGGGGFQGEAMTIPNGNAVMHITLSGIKGIDLAGGSWTAAAWFNGLKSPASWRTLFRGNTNDHQVIVEAGSLRLGLYDNAGAGFVYSGYDVTSVTTGWHHVTAVGSGSSTAFYIDGVLVGTSAAKSIADIFAVGNYQGGGQAFADLIDEVYIYQSALGSSQVQALFQAGANPVANFIADTSAVTVAAGATFDLNGNDETVGSLAGGGNIELGTNTRLTVGADGTSASFSGVISGTGSAGLTKIGAGTQTLGGANDYDGVTTISGGTLVAQHDTALGTTAAGTTVAAGATLALAGNITIGTEALTVNGSLVDSLVNLSGSNTYNGAITVPSLPTGASVGTFTGGDAGEGLDLDGTFPYAVNIRGPAVGLVRNANFTTDAVAGVTVSAQNEILIWTNPSYGSTTNDDNLEVVMQSIRWSGFPATVAVDLAGLTIGNHYNLQLLFAEAGSGRGFDVFVEGGLVADNFNPGAVQGGSNPAVGAVVSVSFIATDTTCNIVLQGDGSFGDNNPILQGLTLENNGPPPAGVVGIRADAGTLTLGGAITLSGAVLTFSGPGSTTANGVIGPLGNSSVVKNGVGTAALGGVNTYTGATTVNAGTLLVNGSITSAVTVKTTATLGGNGTIFGNVTGEAGSSVSPGNAGPDELSIIGNLQLPLSTTYSIQINGPAAGQFDQLIVGQVGQPQTITLGGTLTGTMGFTANGETFKIIDNLSTSSISGLLNGVANNGTITVGGQEFIIRYDGGDGNDVTLQNIVVPKLVNNAVLTVQEGAVGAITSTLLLTTDQQQSAAQVTYLVQTPPARGSIRLSGVPVGTFTQADINNGLITYLHNGSETTSDSFVFTVSDGSNVIGPFTFNITVAPLNDSPVITQGASVSVTMSEDGSPTPFSLGLSATDAENNSLTWSISTAATNGVASVIPPATGGSVGISYVPTANSSGTDSFVVSVSDGVGGSDTITVNVTIEAVNDAPVANTTSLNATVSIPITIDLWTLVSDVETADAALSFSVSNPINGSVILLGDGHTAQFTGNSVGAGSFSYSVLDTGQGSSPPLTTGPVSIDVDIQPQQPVPPVASNNVYNTDEDTAITGNVLTDDTGDGVDSDANLDSLAVTAVNGNAAAVNVPITLPSGATLTVTANGSFSYDPSTSANLRKLKTGQTAFDTFNYTVGDGNGGFDTALVTINLTGVNDPPSGPTAKTFYGVKNTKLKISLAKQLAGFSDPEGDAMHVHVVTPPPIGTLIQRLDGVLVYKPATGFKGTVTFTYVVHDDVNEASSELVTVTLIIRRGLQGNR